MIILGIILLICAVIAVLLQDLLALWLCVILGLFCIYSGLKKKRPQQHNVNVSKKIEPVPPSSPITPKEEPPAQEPKPLWEMAGLSKPTRTLTFKVAGVTFGCKYSEEFSNRQDVLETVEDGDEVTFRQYNYKGRPAVALIHEPTDSDIGVVPSDMTEKVLDYMNQYDVVGLIKDSDWFIPRDDDDDDDDDFESLFNSDDDDEEEKPIYICKVLLCAYKRNSAK